MELLEARDIAQQARDFDLRGRYPMACIVLDDALGSALRKEDRANLLVVDLLSALDTIASYYQPTAVDAASMVKIAKDATAKVKGGAV